MGLEVLVAHVTVLGFGVFIALALSHSNNAWCDFCISLCLAFCLNLQDSSLLGNSVTLLNVVKLQSHWAADENGLNMRDWGVVGQLSMLPRLVEIERYSYYSIQLRAS